MIENLLQTLQFTANMSTYKNHLCAFICRFALSFFVLLMLYHGRQVKVAYSLDFLWKQRAKLEIEKTRKIHQDNNQLLHNILPIHVAKYFLKQDRNCRELYTQGTHLLRNNLQKLQVTDPLTLKFVSVFLAWLLVKGQ